MTHREIRQLPEGRRRSRSMRTPRPMVQFPTSMSRLNPLTLRTLTGCSSHGSLNSA